MNQAMTPRRQFLTIASAASALAVSGRLPVLGAPGPAAPKGKKAGQSMPRQRNIFTTPAAIEPVTGYLTEYRPAAGGTEPLSGTFRATYLRISWGPIHPKTQKPRNRRTGERTVTRSIDGQTARYRLEQETTHGDRVNRLAATVTCVPGAETVAGWELESRFLDAKTGKEISALALAETGTVDGAGVTVDNGRDSCAVALENPLFCGASIVGILSGNPPWKTGFRFDWLQDAASLKPNQQLRHEGAATVPTATGPVQLQSYLQTGYGILPIHYLVDGAGRTQLITQSMENWALQSWA